MRKRGRKPERTPPSLEALEELRKRLADLEGMLPAPWPTPGSEADESAGSPADGATAAPTEESVEGSIDEESEEEEFRDDYPDEDWLPGGSIESEELETAVDELVSDMKEHYEGDEAKSLQELFEILFGERSKVVGAAAEFEDAINGYLGHVFGKDLESAHQSIGKLISFVEKRIQKCKA